ncbi:hypothetical protein V1514DRAFT_175491 [Lipomyces japonicus]|uniref:uncharacterized protein n=1 Tax=Lipomyces japonicus TaxID=56871 RepID=UPI0034CEB149
MSTAPTTTELVKLWATGDAARLLHLARQIESHDAWTGYLTPQEHVLFADAVAKGGDIWWRLISGEAVSGSISDESMSTAAELDELQGNIQSADGDNADDDGDAKMIRPDSVMADVNGDGSPASNLSDTALHTPQASPTPVVPDDAQAPQSLNNAQDSKSIPPQLHSSSSPSSLLPTTAATSTPCHDQLALTFKIRYMLFEKSVDFIFMTRTRDLVTSSTRFDIDFSFLDEEEDEDQDKDQTKHEVAASKNEPPPARRINDDDYDDEEEEEEEDEEETGKNLGEHLQKQQVTSSEELEPPVGQNESKDVAPNGLATPNSADSKITIDGIITPADTPTATDIKLTDDAVRLEIASLYQMLDDDNSQYMKRQDKPEDNSTGNGDSLRNGEHNGISGSGSLASKLSQINFGAANLSLKHLLAAIDDKREHLSFSDIELRNLITEVRKNRSKWASDDRVGQEELYEAAEKVVLELRAYTEHSTAFLNRVNKRDAPNYFNVIKQPMDLSTVMKKLKSLQYNSKNDFVEDLMLIWNNCLKFNADPQHYLRRHALAMRKRTLQLIPLVPDVIIKTRAQVEAEEANIMNILPPSSREFPVLSRDMSVDGDVDSEDGDSVTTGSRGYYRFSSRSGGKGVASSKKAPPLLLAQNQGTDDHIEHGLAVVNHEPAIEHVATSAAETAVLPSSFEYDVVPILPEAPWNLAENQKLHDIEQFEMEVDVTSQPSQFVAARSNGLTSKIDANLAELQAIRKACSKIGVIKRMQQQAHLYTAQLKPYNPPKINEQDVDIDSRLPGHSDVPQAVIEACMQRSVAKLAMHTGYEDCQMLALEGLACMASDFLQRLGRTMALYMEASRGVRRYSLEDVVCQALYENGVDDFAGLESYVRDDIDRFGDKLKDARDRMNQALADYLRPALAPNGIGGSGGGADSQFIDGSQEFVSGGFSDDIGEDFFGFKELGLDQELGLSSLSVPLHLLHSRLHLNSNVQSQPIMQHMIENAPPFEPVTREYASRQIGLFQGFLMARFESHEHDGVLIEDEALPPKQRNQRPKLPPTGKITVIKKRSSEFSFADTSNKKLKI